LNSTIIGIGAFKSVPQEYHCRAAPRPECVLGSEAPRAMAAWHRAQRTAEQVDVYI